jgi:hypothetical protein
MKKSYGVKVGVIFLVVYTLLSLVFENYCGIQKIFGITECPYHPYFTLIQMPGLFIPFILWVGGSSVAGRLIELRGPIFVINGLIYFSLGALAGWMYGKCKYRKETSKTI